MSIIFLLYLMLFSLRVVDLIILKFFLDLFLNELYYLRKLAHKSTTHQNQPDPKSTLYIIIELKSVRYNEDSSCVVGSSSC